MHPQVPHDPQGSSPVPGFPQEHAPEQFPAQGCAPKPHHGLFGHHRPRPPKPARPPRRMGCFGIYFVICGILVNLYGLIWLIIQAFTAFGGKS